MKRKISTLSIILIAALLIYSLGRKEADLHTPDKKEQSHLVKNSSKLETGFKNRIDTVQENSIENYKVKDFINKITDTSISVFERTPKIISLRQMKLTKNDEGAILDHLKKVDLKESQSIKNDLIEHMVRYGSDKSLVGVALLDMITNPLQDRVIREYVLQYIPEFYTNRWRQSLSWDDVEEQDRQLFNQALWDITDLREGSIAGGAIFALYRIADKYEDIDQQEVFKKAESILIDPAYMNPNRMGAVQVLAFSKNENYFETARKIVMDMNQPVLLKVTAIHTATQSQFLDKKFITYLKQISRGGKGIHPSLQKCASLTLLKLK